MFLRSLVPPSLVWKKYLFVLKRKAVSSSQTVMSVHQITHILNYCNLIGLLYIMWLNYLLVMAYIILILLWSPLYSCILPYHPRASLCWSCTSSGFSPVLIKAYRTFCFHPFCGCPFLLCPGRVQCILFGHL